MWNARGYGQCQAALDIIRNHDIRVSRSESIIPRTIILKDLDNLIKAYFTTILLIKLKYIKYYNYKKLFLLNKVMYYINILLNIKNL